MIALLFALLAAPSPEELAVRLRYLSGAGSAEAPAPSPDGQRLAFVTTLFGAPQAASMAVDGGYPFQLTDEPGGVLAVRWAPGETHVLLAVARREGRQRLLFLDEEGAPPLEVDSAPGDQLPGGFSKDGKKLFYAVVDQGKAALKQIPLDTRKPAAIAPPPPAAGQQPARDSVGLDELLPGLFAVGPVSPDGRQVVVLLKRDQGETLALVDVATARGDLLVPAQGHWRSPRFSPDGKTIYALTDAGRKTLGVDALALSPRGRKTVYAPPSDVEAYAISDDGHRLAVGVHQEGETLFSLLELPSLRPQPLPEPPAGALTPAAPGEPAISWNRAGDRIYFGWRLSDDTPDVWAFRLGYGTPVRLTRSPRPGLARRSIPRPALVKIAGQTGWLWRPDDAQKPRVVLLDSSHELRPVFDKRITALNVAGFAVLGFNGPRGTALSWLKEQQDLDGEKPAVIDWDSAGNDLPALVKQASR